jgi:hypothetical protein
LCRIKRRVITATIRLEKYAKMHLLPAVPLS